MTPPDNAQTRSEEAPTIGEVFSIPRQVHQGDFVLKLTEGVDARHAEATLRDYVVTSQLVDCFKESLGLIRGALDAGMSRGAYLHGSFGSGKSHFMAVLSLLLDGDTRARRARAGFRSQRQPRLAGCAQGAGGANAPDQCGVT